MSKQMYKDLNKFLSKTFVDDHSFKCAGISEGGIDYVSGNWTARVVPEILYHIKWDLLKFSKEEFVNITTDEMEDLNSLLDTLGTPVSIEWCDEFKLNRIYHREEV